MSNIEWSMIIGYYKERIASMDESTDEVSALLADLKVAYTAAHLAEQMELRIRRLEEALELKNKPNDPIDPDFTPRFDLN